MTAVMEVRLAGPWELVERIGGGGQADVHRARHADSSAPAAVKVFHRSVWSDRAFRVRFQRECDALTALHHPNIVPILGSGEHDGCGYLAMRLAGGGNLAELIASGPVPPERALPILAGVASALDAAHAAGLVHRDVTPGNILLHGSGTWLADFGIARRLDATILTGEGQLIGTAGYMAPEVLAGARAAPASDRYALAAVAFTTLTGRPVFEGDVLAGVLYAHAHRTPPRPSRVMPGLPRALDVVMAQALAKDPRDRPTSARALVASLERAIGAGATDATRLVTRVQAPPRRRRRVVAPVLATVAGLALLGGGAVAVTAVLSGDPPAATPPPIAATPAPLTVPGPGGREIAGDPVAPGELPGGAGGAEAVAAGVGPVRVVALRGGWETLQGVRAMFRAADYAIAPLVVEGRAVGILAQPPLVADLTGLATRWAMLVVIDGSGTRALAVQGLQDAPARYAGTLARQRGDAIAPVS
jgi:serine/threonine-protein kinase